MVVGRHFYEASGIMATIGYHKTSVEINETPMSSFLTYSPENHVMVNIFAEIFTFWISSCILVMVVILFLILELIKSIFKVITGVDEKENSDRPVNVLLFLPNVLKIHLELCELISEVNSCFSFLLLWR